MARSRVESFEAYAVMSDVRGCRSGALADRNGVHRRTVRQALGNAVPPQRKDPGESAPKSDPAKALIDAVLSEDLGAPRKQRHTACRILARLVDEHQAWCRLRRRRRPHRPRPAGG